VREKIVDEEDRCRFFSTPLFGEAWGSISIPQARKCPVGFNRSSHVVFCIVSEISGRDRRSLGSLLRRTLVKAAKSVAP
jgi:hypothetical protein